MRRNQFGVFLSGPAYLPKVYNGKNKTFWSFNYEGERLTQESAQETFWYPQAFRNGDFSALLTPPIGSNGRPIRAPVVIYDPLTGEPFRGADGQISNIIPANRINKNAQNFINQLPAATPILPGGPAPKQCEGVGAPHRPFEPILLAHRPHLRLRMTKYSCGGWGIAR